MLSAFAIAVAIGALLFHQRVVDLEKWMLLFAVLFAAVGYLGFAVSNGHLNFVADGWIQGFWFTSTVAFIAVAILSYHPFYGFFGRRDIRIWVSIIVMFFLTGALVNIWISIVFTYLILVVAFVAGLFIGFLVQSYLFSYCSRFQWLPYVPLLFLVFASTGKLL
ncbi:putative neutral ceramidase superfamily lipid hydrolase [Geomicrobium halophilum]|uniref:Putative neutral ceramidase superfamily lipid hydrolase n=1 Tax=Geomicrobium halophilum TaxID=549000 RepID=A0A841PNV8_9BACL|nr:hypothetical protein [Geomicrobium halophilum]MBB6448876.1 putative neutral ceramidase superfamily lipid hydrolase [Geomicrobium halophilum]